MSFTIIRNIKHKSNTLNLAFRHNERRNTNYSNKDIDKSKGKENKTIQLKLVMFHIQKELIN